MGVLIIFPAMAKAAGPFRRAVEAARERSETATAICVTGRLPEDMFQGDSNALAKVADGLAEQEKARASAAVEDLSRRAERIGLELRTSTMGGELHRLAAEHVRSHRVECVVLIRPRSALGASEADRAADTLEEVFDGEILIVS